MTPNWLIPLLFAASLPVADATFAQAEAEARQILTGPVQLVYAQPFELREGYTHAWRQDRPLVTAGYVIVVAADTELMAPRQVHSPILFVGDQIAETINVGRESGRVVAFVPTEGSALDVDLSTTPIFYGLPHILPEALTAGDIEGQRRSAVGLGVRPPSATEVRAALEAGGGTIPLTDLYGLRLHAADLIERFSPQEEDLINGLRAPLVRGRARGSGSGVAQRAHEPRRGIAASDPPAGLSAGAPTGSVGNVIERQLAGNPLQIYPFFEFVRAFNQGAASFLAVDPGLLPDLVGETADLYVTAAKTRSEWIADPALVDVSGGAETVFFTAGTIQANTFLIDTGTLSGDAGVGLGLGHDVVIDVDQNGQLNSGDVIDGFGNEAGMYVVHDLTQPGPLAVTEILYSGGSWLGQDTYYPTDIATLGELPLIVVSHGNGHNYQWYDHIGYHMASYGYIVMSHENNTGPGIESASTTTLTNTDYFLGNLDTIAGGALMGHVDSSRITWIGHSRGGEGITRAYDRIYDGTWVPAEYTIRDLRLLSSIAPTDFLGFDDSNPHAANYHLWVGGADADVTGCANNNVAQSFHLLDRARQFRQSISLHGVGHGDFHDGGGSSVATGPCLVGRPDTHVIMRGYLLPLVKHYIEGNIPAEDFLWRQWERFRPIGAPIGNPCVVADLYYRPGDAARKFVIDDFESEPSTAVSSSGGAVTFDVTLLVEAIMDDANSDFTHVGEAIDPMNGMTVAGPTDDTKGIIFTYDSGARQFLQFEVIGAERDFRSDGYLSFRAAQQTRHPLTIAELGDTIFTVTLRDGSGTESAINIGAFGGGLEEPYQRTGCGAGTGWNNEFETIRIPLGGFLHNGSGLDLSDVAAVVFELGPGFGTAAGRIGLDQVEVGPRTTLIFADGFESGDTSAWSSTIP